jgi:hypothetical protein
VETRCSTYHLGESSARDDESGMNQAVEKSSRSVESFTFVVVHALLALYMKKSQSVWNVHCRSKPSIELVRSSKQMPLRARVSCHDASDTQFVDSSLGIQHMQDTPSVRFPSYPGRQCQRMSRSSVALHECQSSTRSRRSSTCRAGYTTLESRRRTPRNELRSDAGPCLHGQFTLGCLTTV